MREILFRGKRADNGKWVESFYFEEIGSFIKEKPSSVSTNTYLVKPETVGQYTGLTDKNGKKIFEGDIVKIDVYENLKPIIAVVVWEPKYAVFALNGARCHTNFYNHWGEETEVIGNIHDNPELLKGGAEE